MINEIPVICHKCHKPFWIPKNDFIMSSICVEPYCDECLIKKEEQEALAKETFKLRCEEIKRKE